MVAVGIDNGGCSKLSSHELKAVTPNRAVAMYNNDFFIVVEFFE
jgi:hypothetical protein